MIEVTRLHQSLFEEPALDRYQRRLARNQPLLSDYGHGAPGHHGEVRNGLLLEHLPRSEVQTGTVGPRHHLDRLDRIAAERKEIVVNADAIEAEHVAPDRG